jgi:hypothetical protein
VGREKIKPLALQSKEKSGRNCNLGATEMPEKSLLRKHALELFAPTLVKGNPAWLTHNHGFSIRERLVLR